MDAMGKFGLGAAPAAAMLLARAPAGGGSCGGLPGWGIPPPPPNPFPAEPRPAPEIPASIRSSEVIGRWGYASFHRPEDRVRTEAAAKGQCSHPFVIGQGPTGGVMMYPPHPAPMQEFLLKGGPRGHNYNGPHGPSG